MFLTQEVFLTRGVFLTQGDVSNTGGVCNTGVSNTESVSNTGGVSYTGVLLTRGAFLTLLKYQGQMGKKISHVISMIDAGAISEEKTLNSQVNFFQGPPTYPVSYACELY